MSLHDELNITQLAMETVERHGSVISEKLNENLTLVQVVSEVVQELETQREMSEAEYEQFLADVWVGVVLTLMVLSCVCCMCSCLLYHKFQQWKRHVLEQRAAASTDPDRRGGDAESLPSYTLVSGLPSYEEALEQLKQVQALRRDLEHVVVDCGKHVEAETSLPLNAASLNHCSYVRTNHQMSVAELLQLYKLQQQQQQQQLPQYQQQIGTPDIQQQGIAKI